MHKLHGFPAFMAFLMWTGLAATLILPMRAAGEVEQTFDVLQIGTHIYTNVTVTTKAKNYVILLHSAGLTTIKVADIPPELRETLGYNIPVQKPKSAGATAANWAKDTMAYLNISHVKAAEKRLGESWSGRSAEEFAKLKAMSRSQIYLAAGGLAAIYLIYCFFLMLICQKTGKDPGILIWLPVFQIFPILRAAGMSGAWFLAFLVPGVNIVAIVVWCFKIAKARGKSAWSGFFLCLPVTFPLAFLYLALSNGSSNGTQPARDIRRGTQIMSLEIA